MVLGSKHVLKKKKKKKKNGAQKDTEADMKGFPMVKSKTAQATK